MPFLGVFLEASGTGTVASESAGFTSIVINGPVTGGSYPGGTPLPPLGNCANGVAIAHASLQCYAAVGTVTARLLVRRSPLASR